MIGASTYVFRHRLSEGAWQKIKSDKNKAAVHAKIGGKFKKQKNGKDRD